MKKIEANDIEAQSANIVADNLSQLQSLFPEAFAEGKVQFDVLRQLLGGAVDEADEKYGLNWHGKRRARQIALTPSTGTLRPCPDESVDWDTTQNLMIEGDNLEVLKLLQKSYAGKVKMIYIDPPYNTGKDFVYPDNFRDSIENYLQLTGQVEGGTKVSANTDASGRFHTDWLNMMYPRLRLARNLLRNDGLVLISTDEVEADNIKKICDEIFGNENFVERIVWKNKYGSGALTKGFANVHEYILVYSREPIEDIAAPLNDEQRAAYKLKDEKYSKRGGYITQPLATTSKDPRPNLVYPILHNGVEIWPEKQWIWSKDRLDEAYRNNDVVINETNGKYSVRVKQYLYDENGVERLGKPLSLMNGPFNQEGTKDIASLFSEKVFSFPKPVALLRYFASLVVNGNRSNDGLILDFFAGSGSTAHAVMEQNASDGGSRRFILVQMPEPISEGNIEQKAAALFCDRNAKNKNISEITKERLRRAGKKIKENHPMFSGDVGFRVFKLDKSNIRAWNPNAEKLNQSLLDHNENILDGRTEADITYELLLKLGLDLCVPIEKRTVAGKSVKAVGGGVLMLCLAEKLVVEEVEAVAAGIIAWHKELAPAGDSTVVFRDSAFDSDVAKTNMAAILAQNGLENVRSL